MKHEKIHGSSHKENADESEVHSYLDPDELHTTGKLEVVTP